MMDNDVDFQEYWMHVEEAHSEKSEYFASIMNEQIPFDCEWIEQEYYRHGLYYFNKIET